MKQVLFDILLGEIWCSETLKNVLKDILKNWWSYIWNSYEFRVEDNRIIIENLYNSKEVYKIDIKDFIEIIEEFFKTECK